MNPTHSFLSLVHTLLTQYIMLARHFVRPATTRSIAARAARRTMAARAGSSFVKYNWHDPLNLDKLLTDEERMVRYVYMLPLVYLS